MDFWLADKKLVLPMVLRENMHAIATSLDNNGVVLRVHKNSKTQPNHSLTYGDRERIKHLFLNMQEAMP